MTDTFTEADRLAAPLASHHISDERAVCDGTVDSRCHFQPTCCEDLFDPDHEHEYVKDGCGWLEWINAADLEETFDPKRPLPATLLDSLTWPDGLITPTWTGDGVLWTYAIETTPEEADHA